MKCACILHLIHCTMNITNNVWNLISIFITQNVRTSEELCVRVHEHMRASAYVRACMKTSEEFIIMILTKELDVEVHDQPA